MWPNAVYLGRTDWLAKTQLCVALSQIHLPYQRFLVDGFWSRGQPERGAIAVANKNPFKVIAGEQPLCTLREQPVRRQCIDFCGSARLTRAAPPQS